MNTHSSKIFLCKKHVSFCCVLLHHLTIHFAQYVHHQAVNFQICHTRYSAFLKCKSYLADLNFQFIMSRALSYLLLAHGQLCRILSFLQSMGSGQDIAPICTVARSTSFTVVIDQKLQRVDIWV